MNDYLTYFGTVSIILILLWCSWTERTKRYPLQLAKSRSREVINKRITVFYQGQEYDVTEFLKVHPGGKTNLLNMDGKDVEARMKKIGHSDHAFERLQGLPKINSNQ